MQIVVKGKNYDVPSQVKEEAVTKLSKVRTLFDRFIDMEVVFTEEANPRITDRIRCEVVLHAKGKYLRAEGAGADPSTAIDQAQSKLTRQVRKLKTKLVSKSRRQSAEVNEAVLSGVATEGEY